MIKLKGINCKFKIYFVVLTLAFFGQDARSQSWQWMKGAHNGESTGAFVTTDSQSNVYATGMCWFDGTFGADSFSVEGGVSSTPIIKYDSLGNLKWMRMISHAAPCGLATDLFGNEYLLCAYQDSVVTFGGHILLNPHPKSGAYFLAKLNSFGDVLWMKNIGNANTENTNVGQLGNSLATDGCGNIYLTCGFSDDLSIGSFHFKNASIGPIKGADILVSKFDSTGGLLWANVFGGIWNDLPTGIAVTNSGNIYVGGMFNSDSLQIGNTILRDTIKSVLHWNCFLIKLDNSGNPQWARTTTGTTDCEVYGLASDYLGNVFISGCYAVGYYPPAAITFGTITLPIVPTFQSNGFIVKYDKNGNAIWGRVVKGKYVIQYGVAVDPRNNIWIFGMNLADSSNQPISDTIDGHILVAPMLNTNPVFIAGWDNSGSYITSTALPSGSRTYCNGIGADRAGDILITCNTQMDTFILAGDSLYNTTGPAFMGHPFNMYVAKFNSNIKCPYLNIALGCSGYDSVEESLGCDKDQIFLPNSFTPNNDGKNDVFYPRGAGLSKIKTFRIFNRWGELLFEKLNFDPNDAASGWDGSYLGEKPRPDVYVYLVDAVCESGEPLFVKGDVTIIR